jgi:hypothetical protein
VLIVILRDAPAWHRLGARRVIWPSTSCRCFPSSGSRRRCTDRLFREDRRELSPVDRVTFEFMRAPGLREALALDEDLAAAGRRLLLTSGR